MAPTTDREVSDGRPSPLSPCPRRSRHHEAAAYASSRVSKRLHRALVLRSFGLRVYLTASRQIPLRLIGADKLTETSVFVFHPFWSDLASGIPRASSRCAAASTQSGPGTRSTPTGITEATRGSAMRLWARCRHNHQHRSQNRAPTWPFDTGKDVMVTPMPSAPLELIVVVDTLAEILSSARQLARLVRTPPPGAIENSSTSTRPGWVPTAATTPRPTSHGYGQ